MSNIFKRIFDYDKLKRELERVQFENKIFQKQIAELKRENEFSKNKDLKTVYDLINSGKNVFVTGGAGTGKSYILNKLKQFFPELEYNTTSSTGVSAYNVGGVTIHSWGKLGIFDDSKCIDEQLVEKLKYVSGETKEKIRQTNLLAIDEVSMISDNLLSFLDVYFQKIRGNEKPFGGIQVVFFGDFCQLPPVIKDKEDESMHYAFNSRTWQDLNVKAVLLKEIHRQNNDKKFALELENIRLGKNLENAEEFFKDCIIDCSDNNYDDVTHLFEFNANVKKHNEKCFEKICSEPVSLICKQCFVKQVKNNNGLIEYVPYRDLEVTKEDYTDKHKDCIENDTKVMFKLELKIGCKVMVIRNIDVANGITNGSTGIVRNIENDTIYVDFPNKENYPIGKINFIYQTKNKGCKKYIQRTQFPLVLAYAITIHKSQGLTFDEIVLNLSADWIKNSGQIYVALSRVKTLKGLHIVNRFPKEKINVSKDVQEFYNNIDK